MYDSSLMPAPENSDSAFLQLVTKLYAEVLQLGFALLPLVGILYIKSFIDPSYTYSSYGFHQFAIAVATAEGLFVTTVSYQCYRHSGEPFLKWITLGFGGFTLLYAPHGPLTMIADNCLRLFLIFGPLSRFVMSMCLLIGVMVFGHAHLRDGVVGRAYWFKWLGVFAALASLAGWGALEWPAQMLDVQRGLECASLIVSVFSLLLMAVRKIQAALIRKYFAVSVLFFAQSSWAFLWSAPWNHMWWYAHGIFAAGFAILSYGVVQAYFTTKDFSTVLSQAEMTVLTRESQQQAERALLDLQEAHRELQVLASTDSLTGAANRREFLARTEEEMAKAKRSKLPVSLVMMDLDYFKQINDQHGHMAGDEVLKSVIRTTMQQLRPGDVVGRLGGEEFAILLPYAAAQDALVIAERLRETLADAWIDCGTVSLQTTVSMGVAQWLEGDTSQQWFAKADMRLYQAKQRGRNQVVLL